MCGGDYDRLRQQRITQPTLLKREPDQDRSGGPRRHFSDNALPHTYPSRTENYIFKIQNLERVGGGRFGFAQRHGENVSCGTRKITCPRSRKPYRRCCRGSKSADVSKREAGLRQMRSIMPRGQTLGGVPWRWGRVSLMTIQRGVGAAKLEVSDAWDR